MNILTSKNQFARQKVRKIIQSLSWNIIRSDIETVDNFIYKSFRSAKQKRPSRDWIQVWWKRTL